MRKLAKLPTPAVLVENKEAWTTEYAKKSDNYSRYRHADIRAALARETYYKCAYCESTIEAVAPLHVEHILPKSHRPDLVVDWENLTIACPNCNYKKGSYYSDSQPLINPYVQDPAEHISFIGCLVFPKDDSDLGTRSIARIGLARTALRQSREARLYEIDRLVKVWRRAEGEDREMYAEFVRDEAGPDREYSEAARAFLRARNFPIDD